MVSFNLFILLFYSILIVINFYPISQQFNNWISPMKLNPNNNFIILLFYSV